MKSFKVIGESIPRKESWDKVTGRAKYTSDNESNKYLHARLVTSTYAHARIKSIDVSEARQVFGVRAILTGKDCPFLTGSTIMDKPPIAIDKVIYHGEPVALIVADREVDAKRVAELIKVEYEELPVVNSPSEAFRRDSPLVHEKLGEYRIIDEVFPQPGTNIANLTRIRKGSMEKGWAESEVVTEINCSFPQSDHVAMETRASIVEILPDGQVIILTSSQSPFHVRKLMNTYFNIELGKVIVKVPLVGGAYGGKTPIHLEVLGYLASKAVGGRPVKLVNYREEDMISSPVHIGLDARVKLGCTKSGVLRAAEITFLFDGGAFADRAVIITRAAAVDCTGPYKIENVSCNSYCMYTNHPFATAFRGFGHSELTFAIERAVDSLARKLKFDPLYFRLINAIAPGDTTPTQVILNRSNVGNLQHCIHKLAGIMEWDEEQKIKIENHKVRAKGVSCFWKTSNTPVNAGAGAILTFNSDGSININNGAIELGQGTKTVLAQIAAQKMKMDVDRIHVFFEVNTRISPEHWKTAASRTTLLVGRAVVEACNDAINQLKIIASIVLKVPQQELEVGYERVYKRDNPNINIDIKDIAFGYKHLKETIIGHQVIGRGSYALENLTPLDPDTGRGVPGPEWTVGASAVEVEINTRDFTYKILRAATVVDAGKVLNFEGARGQIAGGMNMGLSFASREQFQFNNKGIVLNPSIRTYKIMRFGDNPKYLVDFVETPHREAPYGARGIGEHGVIGMPAALANCLSTAIDAELNNLPLIPELIWRIKRGDEVDSI